MSHAVYEKSLNWLTWHTVHSRQYPLRTVLRREERPKTRLTHSPRFCMGHVLCSIRPQLSQASRVEQARCAEDVYSVQLAL
eukprot:2175760-Amphidinium_carterae.2